MGGGLMQLVAYGAQDIYLTGNPQITFFKVVYRRHTNFSMECINQTINGQSEPPGASSRSTAIVSRNGDLIYRMHMKTTRASSTAIVNEGVGQWASVELEIGGQQIDKHSATWLEVYAELTQNDTGRAFGTNYQLTTGSCEAGGGSQFAATAVDGTTDTDAVFFYNQASADDIIYTPLQFWFCRNPGLALPLIALQYHEVKVIFNWAATVCTQTQHELWVDYIYLDTDERRRFAQVSHEY